MNKKNNFLLKINEYLNDTDKLSFIALSIDLIYLAIKYLFVFSASIVKHVDFNIDKYLFICTLINLFIIILRIKKKEIKLKDIDLVFLILNLCYVISVIFNPNVYSLFGKTGRLEGLTSLILYATIYFVARCIKDKKYIKKIITVILHIGIINVLVALMQSYFNLFDNGLFKHMGFGLMDNPNMFGLYMITLLSLVLVLFLKTNNKTYLACTLIYYIGILLSDSTMPFATMCLIFLIVLIYFIKKKLKLKKLITLFGIMLLIFPIIEFSLIKVNRAYYGDYTKNTYVINDIKSIVGKVIPIKDDEITNSDITSGRLEIWKLVLITSKDHILFGKGPDNLFIYKQGNTVFYDKAHNHYLEVYATSGIFAAISYIAFVVLTFIDSNKKNYISLALLLAFISYSIDIFASISTPLAAIYYYLIIGLLMTIKDNKMILR